MSRGPSRVPFSGDGVLARVLASLPTPLVRSELDVATTLRDYLRMNVPANKTAVVWSRLRAPLLRLTRLLHTGNNYLYDQLNGWVRRAVTQEPTTQPLQRAAKLKPTMRPLYERAATQKPTLRSLVLVHPLSTAILLPIRGGGPASQTATCVLLDLPDSASFVGPELRDGLPSSAEIAKMTSGYGSDLEADFAPFSIGKKSEATRHVSAEASGHPESELSPHQMPGVDGHPSTSEHRYSLPEHADQSMGPSVKTALQKQSTSSLNLEQVDQNDSEGCSTKERNSKRRRRVRKEYAKQKPKDSTGNNPNKPMEVFKVNSSFSASQHRTSSTMSSVSIATVLETRTSNRRIRPRIITKRNQNTVKRSRSLLDGMTKFPILYYFISPWYQIVRSRVAISNNSLLWSSRSGQQQSVQTVEMPQLRISQLRSGYVAGRNRKGSKRVSSATLDQFVLTSEVKPKRFRSRYQAKSFQGPTARQEAESAERSKWLDIFADIFLATSTPMGKLLREDRASRRILGAGRRAATI